MEHAATDQTSRDCENQTPQKNAADKVHVFT